MTTLSADAPRKFLEGIFQHHGVIADDVIYTGAAVGENGSGYARPLEAGDPFLGFADGQADNTGGSAGDIAVRCRTSGLAELSISGVAITDVGKDVYASDDDTFVLTEGSNTRIGFVQSVPATGTAIVAFSIVESRMAELTDSTTGTAAASLVDVTSSFDQDKLNDNFASLAAKVNTLIRRTGG